MDVPLLLRIDAAVCMCLWRRSVFRVGPETPEKSVLVISAVAPVNSY